MATNSTPMKSELLEELLSRRAPETLFESNGLLDKLNKALAEGGLHAEMGHHLSWDAEHAAGNDRNGTTAITCSPTRAGWSCRSRARSAWALRPVADRQVRAQLPRIRPEAIAPQARDVGTSDIQAKLRDLYGVATSRKLVSVIAGAVIDEVAAWKNRPLEPVDAVVFFDAPRVKIGDRAKGAPGAADRANRRGQVLAAVDERES